MNILTDEELAMIVSALELAAKSLQRAKDERAQLQSVEYNALANKIKGVQ